MRMTMSRMTTKELKTSDTSATTRVGVAIRHQSARRGEYLCLHPLHLKRSRSPEKEREKETDNSKKSKGFQENLRMVIKRLASEPRMAARNTVHRSSSTYSSSAPWSWTSESNFAKHNMWSELMQVLGHPESSAKFRKSLKRGETHRVPMANGLSGTARRMMKDVEHLEVGDRNTSSLEMSESCGDICNGLVRFFMICFEQDRG